MGKFVDIITTGEAAQLLRVDKQTLRNWHKTGRLVPQFINKLTKRRYYTRRQIKLFKEREEKKYINDNKRVS